MSEVVRDSSTQQAISYALQRLAVRPDWLMAPLQRTQLLEALARHIPEVARGDLRLVDCKNLRLLLKDRRGRWRGTYRLVVEGMPAAPQQVIPLRVTLSAPDLPPPSADEQPTPRPFGTEGWSCYLPELRLYCELDPPEENLQDLPRLTDPEQARTLLERSIRAGAPDYREIRIQACRPQVLNYKPGSRCTLRYDLDYAPADAGRGWPRSVIAKTYDDRTGEQAYEGMLSLWRSPLSTGDVVRIAEPYAYVPEMNLLIQAPLQEEQTLEQLLRSTLQAGTSEAFTRLEYFVRASAAGLAALHQSGAHAEETVTWDERVSEIPDLIERLAAVAPDLTDSLDPLVRQLHSFAAANPADPLVPSHGSFDSDQVLIAQDQISFIDFDSFCAAEPALDVGHFRAAIMDSGMQVIDERTLRDPELRQAYLQRLDALGMVFLTEYEAHAPISRQRLVLWEALDYLRDAIHLWKKPKPSGVEAVLAILEYHLRSVGWLV